MDRLLHLLNEERPVPLQFIKNGIELCSFLYNHYDLAVMYIFLSISHVV